MINSLYDTFKHWSGTGSVWIISDPHFKDTDTKLMNPAWIKPEEHIEKINAKVHKNDTLLCLGDCGDIECFNQLKAGYKVLIKGNHDDKGNSHYLKVFDEVYSGPLFISDRILLSHEPVIGLTYTLNLHGHVHNGEFDRIDALGARHLNFASDVVNWEVYSLGELIKCGYLADVPTIHRMTIDRAIENPIHK